MSNLSYAGNREYFKNFENFEKIVRGICSIKRNDFNLWGNIMSELSPFFDLLPRDSYLNGSTIGATTLDEQSKIVDSIIIGKDQQIVKKNKNKSQKLSIPQIYKLLILCLKSVIPDLKVRSIITFIHGGQTDKLIYEENILEVNIRLEIIQESTYNCKSYSIFPLNGNYLNSPEGFAYNMSKQKALPSILTIEKFGSLEKIPDKVFSKKSSGIKISNHGLVFIILFYCNSCLQSNLLNSNSIAFIECFKALLHQVNQSPRDRKLYNLLYSLLKDEQNEFEEEDDVLEWNTPFFIDDNEEEEFNNWRLIDNENTNKSEISNGNFNSCKCSISQKNEKPHANNFRTIIPDIKSSSMQGEKTDPGNFQPILAENENEFDK